jgi:methionyl aminopeptidase
MCLIKLWKISLFRKGKDKEMITIKSKNEQEIMREGGKRLAQIMKKLEDSVRPGINTLEIDKLAEKLVFDNGGKPSFKGYSGDTGRGFPATICASINDEVVHGIPGEKKILKNGDVFKIDIGMEYEGFHTDMARSYAIGKCSGQASKIMEVTEKCFWKGIKKLKAGKMLSDYSRAVQGYVEKNGFSLVRNLVGHGIGREIHEDPQIPNYYNKKYQDIKLQSGMTLAFEPMVNAGDFETVLGHDGWVFKTRDGSLSAHYENTVLITEKGVEVLTIV